MPESNGQAALPLTVSLATFVPISGIPLRTLRQMANDGTLPCIRTGKRGTIRVLRIPALEMLGQKKV